MDTVNTFLDTFGLFFITLSRFKGTLIYMLQKNEMIKGFLPVFPCEISVDSHVDISKQQENIMWKILSLFTCSAIDHKNEP